MTFTYTNTPENILGGEDFVLRVPSGICFSTELFMALADVGGFPDYFGHNWDALLDFLRDLSWIKAKRVVVLHTDVPLIQNTTECRTYLQVLQAAFVDWQSPPNQNAIAPPSEWPYVEHEIEIVFPVEAKSAIEHLLSK
jgi:Barstar (barnase inhibitor)